MVAPKVVVVCLSEDRDKDVEVVKLLVRAIIIRVIDPNTQTQHVHFEPYNSLYRPSVIANAWESTSPRDQQRITELNRYLATLLKMGGSFRVIVHHLDADCPWDVKSTCPRLILWRKVVWQAVANLAGVGHAARLVPLVPHPEIEGWLYLNRTVLEREAAREGREAPTPPDGGWDGIPDVKGVKDRYPWPRDSHNISLAQSFPAVRAKEQSPSLAAAIAMLSEIPGFPEALAETWAIS